MTPARCGFRGVFLAAGDALAAIDRRRRPQPVSTSSANGLRRLARTLAPGTTPGDPLE
jgi:hypothetical protein